jgi:hypothetical protein
MQRWRFVLGVLVLAFVGCGPTAEDHAKMKEKMALETTRAELIRANLADCEKLEAVLGEWNEANREARRGVDAWWRELSSGAKDKLIDANKAAWDVQSVATMQGTLKCSAQMKRAMKSER